MKGRTVSDTSVAATLTAKGTKSPGQRQQDLLGDGDPRLVLGLDRARPRGAARRRPTAARTAATRWSAPSRTRRAPAPCTWPSRMASARSSSSTIPPRATLMIRTPGLALASRSFADQPERLLGLGQVDRDEVRMRRTAPRGPELHAHVPGPLRRDEGVVGDEPHPEGQRPLGDESADPPEADDAERLAVQLDALPLRALPLAGHQSGVGLGDVAGLGEQQGHRLLGGREDVRLRGVDHHHAPLRSPRATSTLSSPMPARPTTTSEVAGRLSTSAVDLRGRADDRGRARRRPRRQQLLGGQSQRARRPRGRRGAARSRPALGDLLGHQYPCHARILSRRSESRLSHGAGVRATTQPAATRLGQAGEALDEVVVAQGVAEPEVARRAEGLARHDGDLGLRRCETRPARRSTPGRRPRSLRPSRPVT